MGQYLTICHNCDGVFIDTNFDSNIQPMFDVDESQFQELAFITFDSKDESETPTSIEYGDGRFVQRADRPENPDFLKGCPVCETDGCLGDVTDISQIPNVAQQ